MNPYSLQWVKGKVIGEGSFGKINLAMNKTTGAIFVVKSAHYGNALEALVNEASILEILDSPYIVKCLGKNLATDNGSLNGKINLFMEYMAGGSLAEVAEKFGGSLNEQVIRSYTKEILKGLNYLHDNGIVHCDLKCKNVLLGSSGNIKLADFGCAVRIKNNSTTQKSCSIGGTPLWMAPEALRHEGLDFSADIWSLGCTVIEMATGKPPLIDHDHTHHDPMAAIMKIACGNEKPKFPSKFSKEGIDFLGKCLDRNPKKRWTTEQLLNHPFIDSRRDEAACSPASVLHFEETYESSSDVDDNDDDDDDELENYHEKMFSHHPIMVCDRKCKEIKRTPKKKTKKKKMKSRKEAEMYEIWSSSQNWITVRSSG